MPLTHLADERQMMSAVTGSKPLVITEVGYHTDMAYPGPHRPASERAVASYTPRIALEAFRFGIDRTYLYTLADLWSDAEAQARGFSKFENSFGLLRADLTPKPSFVALRNLLRAVNASSQPVANPGGLRYRLQDAGPDVRQLLLRSADGGYALALWRNVSVWNRDTQQDLTPTPDQLSITLGQPIAQAAQHNPTQSDTPIQYWAYPRSIPISLGGDPVVVRLTP